MSNVACLEPLALHAGVRAHGMYMFAMRYRQEHCGRLSVESFLDFVQAEGAPVYRAFTVTMSDQPAIQNLMKKRPEYFRRFRHLSRIRQFMMSFTFRKMSFSVQPGTWKKLLPPLKRSNDIVLRSANRMRRKAVWLLSEWLSHFSTMF